jgi:glycosyltransferase involved in cell wall biosynthesis
MSLRSLINFKPHSPVTRLTLYGRSVRQSLSHRMAQNAQSTRAWPHQQIRIALVITDLNVGGAERALVSLALRLDKSRWQPAVFCLDKPGPLVEVLHQGNVPCECLSADRRNSIHAVIQLARGFRRFKPRLVQSFMFHANLAARLAALWAGLPWVIGGLRVAERQKSWHLILDRLTAGLSTGSVCVSQGVLRFSREVARLNPARLTVIPNGIDIAPFATAPSVPRLALGVPDNSYLAICVGRLDRQKGLSDLLVAAERLIHTRPDWHLALAGDGPCRHWLLEQIANRPVLSQNVHWLGHRDDIPNLLKSADVLVQPSLWEGMPNSVLEAMAAGLPVVGTSVEGTEDLVVPGQTGWLTPTGDASALYRVLLEAAESPDRLRRYGRAGQVRAERQFSLGTTVAAYERLWAAVLGYRLDSALRTHNNP